MVFDIKDYFSLATILLATITLYLNHKNNMKSRQIRATIDLYNAYYNNKDFVASRLNLWKFLSERD